MSKRGWRFFDPSDRWWLDPDKREQFDWYDPKTGELMDPYTYPIEEEEPDFEFEEEIETEEEVETEPETETEPEPEPEPEPEINPFEFSVNNYIPPIVGEGGVFGGQFAGRDYPIGLSGMMEGYGDTMGGYNPYTGGMDLEAYDEDDPYHIPRSPIPPRSDSLPYAPLTTGFGNQMYSGSPYSFPGGVEALAYHQPESLPQSNLRDLAYYQQQTFLPHIWERPEELEETSEEEEEST